MTITAPSCQFNGFSKLASWVASCRMRNHLPTCWRSSFTQDNYGGFKVRFPMALWQLNEPGDDGIDLVFDHADELQLPPSDHSFIVTGMQNRRLSSDALAILKQYKKVIWPDVSQANAAIAFGVDRSSFAYPPTDTRIYYPVERKRTGKRFGFVAKSKAELQLGLDVWFESFPNVDGVELSIKLEPGIKLPTLNDNRISTITGWLEPYQLANWYRGLDCFLATGTGKYFDWHVEQAEHCGTPTVGASWNVSYGCDGCSSGRGRLLNIERAVDWFRLCNLDPECFHSSPLDMAITPDQYAHDIHQIIRCADLPHFATPVTQETSSTACPSCAG